ncbi:hypothetical protein [Bacillus sp. Marseille-P3661]|uniref:hypothetical protein n=1 Tax=Bacillus sp. Marseille-P3661 TaxID=1936234 RepID=UPI000C844892|nr:hypothetical protein [Bacillus sp. Marseille-P3661]
MVKRDSHTQFIATLDHLIKFGPKWKNGKGFLHLNKRKNRGHIPKDWTMNDYNQLILNIVKNLQNEV